MRKKLLSILALLCLTVSSAWAEVIYSGNCGPTGNESAVTWQVTDDYKLTISGTGAMADYTSPYGYGLDEPKRAPWREEFCSPIIASIEIGEGVTHIGNFAFWNCDMSSIVIPANVKSIGNGAFEQCSGLASVTLNEGLETIGAQAFNACSLTSITIPASVTSIGPAFVNQNFNLEGFTVVSGNQVYITTDDNSMIIDNTTHTLIATCASKTEINIPNTVTTIGESAFINWKGTSISIPDNVTTIGPAAFQFSTMLTSIEIPSSVTSIGIAAFYNCLNLNTITLNSNPYIGVDAFVQQKYNYNPDTDEETWTVSYPNSVTMNLAANADETGAYWMTFNNENYSFTPDANTTAYKGVLNGNSLTLVPVADVLADNAVVLKSTSSAVTMTLTTSPTTTSDDFTGNALTSVNWADNPMNTPTNCYTLSRGHSGTGPLGFYKYSGPTLNYGKAYLTYPGTGARDFIGFDEGGATAIEAPAATINVENGDIYDLTGRRIESQPAKKGIYVKNGQKFIVK